MSFSQTSVRPRLLFGRYIQAYCKRDDEHYQKSTLDLDSYLGNNNGTFTTNRAKALPINSLHDIDNNIHLDGSNIVSDLPTKSPGRNRATYDLDICLCNDNGELKWVKHDDFLARDGAITKAVEAIPGVGFLVAWYHHRNNDPDHAKRALIMSGKGLFAILFGVMALQVGPFDPTAALVVGALSLLGTIIADLTIETYGRVWIKDKRIAADIPDRTWGDTLMDGLIAGAAVGVATGIAPHAEEAATRAIRAAALVPEEMMVAEFEMLSVQSLVSNGPKLAKEIAKAGTGGVVRGTSFGIYGFATRAPDAEKSSAATKSNSKLAPGHYYISNLQTGQLLQFIVSGKTGRPCIQVSEGNFKKSQLWIIEEGEVGYKMRAYFPSAYIGRTPTDGSEDSTPIIVAPDDAVEFKIEGDHKEGFVFIPIVDASDELALGVDDSETAHAAVHFTENNGSKKQRWLFEEDDGQDVLGLHEGPLHTNTLFRICDATNQVALRLPVTQKKGFMGWPAAQGKSSSAAEWVLEAGFNAYYLKHLESGLYVTVSEAKDDIKIRPLALSPNGSEFTLIGDEDNGFSIAYAADSKYGIVPEEDASDSSATAYLSWQLDDSHPRWRFESL